MMESFFGPDAKTVKELLAKVRARIVMPEEEPLTVFLGMEINYKPHEQLAEIKQTKYIRSLLYKYRFAESNVTSRAPLPNGYHLQESGDLFDKPEEYQSLVGALMWIGTHTRPEICFGVSALCRHMIEPRVDDWRAAKHILKYLAGTATLGLRYDMSDGDLTLRGYSDASWGGSMSVRKSTTGLCFQLGRATVSWSSKQQSITALSSAESELIALATTLQQALYLQQMLGHLKVPQPNMVVFEDNQACLCMSLHEMNKSRARHLDMRLQFIREKIMSQHIAVRYCETNQMLADVMTKSLSGDKFRGFRARLLG